MEAASVTRHVTLLVVALALGGCGAGGGEAGGTTSGGDVGGGTPGGASPPLADLTGKWNVTERGVSNCPGQATYENPPAEVSIAQRGNALAVVTRSGTFDGTIDGNTAGWTGSFPSANGTTTITAMTLTIATNGNAFSGSANWVWADATSNCSGTSQSINAARILQAGPVPSAPTALSGSPQSSSSIALVWNDNANNESGFKLERRRSGEPDTAFAQVALIAVNATSHTDTGLNALTAYDYRIRAYNASGDSAYSNVSTATTLAAPVPAPLPPSQLALTVNSSSSITLNWIDGSANETSFKIERSTNASSGFTQIATVGASVTSYQNTGLAAATRYFYRVRASNATGDSAYTNTADATTQPAPVAPAAPSSLKADAANIITRIDLSWKDNSTNETGFKIERSTNSNSGFTQIATTAAGVTTFSDIAGLSPNTTYYYRVRSTNANTGLDSGYSNTDSAKTDRLGGGDDDD